MSDYIEVLDETDPGSILDGDTRIHTHTYIILIILQIFYMTIFKWQRLFDFMIVKDI